MRWRPMPPHTRPSVATAPSWPTAPVGALSAPSSHARAAMSPRRRGALAAAYTTARLTGATSTENGATPSARTGAWPRMIQDTSCPRQSHISALAD